MEETLNHRKPEGKNDAILASDAACFLSHNKHFVECKRLEKWWHNTTTTEWVLNNRNITVVCPHPGLILNDHLLSETKGRLNATHTITIDLNQSIENQKKKTKQKKTKRILIAEPEPDIQVLYSLFTKQYGFSISDVSIVESGNKCLEIVFSNRRQQQQQQQQL